MEYSLFSATGCMRCKIAKAYMKENSIAYQEFDIKADGKNEFNTFYRKNRSSIFRGEEGVEFPLLWDGEKVFQGVGVITAGLINKNLLGSFVARSELSHGWINGLDVSGGDISLADEFVTVVAYLKTHGLQTQIETDGRNAEILKQLVDNALVDRLFFNLKGPADLYEDLTGRALDEDELTFSLSLIEKCPEYQVTLPLQAFERKAGQYEIITPEEASLAAALVEQATGKKTHPFFIKDCISAKAKETLPALNLFKYRTACRRYMVKTEISKQ